MKYSISFIVTTFILLTVVTISLIFLSNKVDTQEQILIDHANTINKLIESDSLSYEMIKRLNENK